MDNFSHIGFGTLADVVIAIILIGALYVGWKRGGITSFFTLLGVIIGITLGITLTPLVLEDVAGQGRRFMAVIGILAIGLFGGFIVGKLIGEKFQKDATRQLDSSAFRTINSILGSVCTVLLAGLLIWCLTIPYAENSPYKTSAAAQAQAENAERGIQGSHNYSTIFALIDSLLPNVIRSMPREATEVVRGSEITAPGAEEVNAAGMRTVEPPNAELEFGPVAQDVRPSIVRVLSQSLQCNKGMQGTGFVVDRDTVLTNAHVVAGSERTIISTMTGRHPVDVVYFDAAKDIAILRGIDLGLPSLEWSTRPASINDDALVIGYPLDGDYQVNAARVRDREHILTATIYDNEETVTRDTYILRSLIQQGNSGGPLLNTDGDVLGMVYGASPETPDTAFALTKDEIMDVIGTATVWSTPTETGACVTG